MNPAGRTLPDDLIASSRSHERSERSEGMKVTSEGEKGSIAMRHIGP
jgi:hypothetical protein